MNIKLKLLLSLVITALLPVLIIVSITTWQIVEDAEQKFIDTSTVDISIAEQSFANFFEDMGHLVSFMADSQAVRQSAPGAISNYFTESRKPSEVAKANGGLELELFNLFSAIGNNNPKLGFVYMSNTAGEYAEWPGTDNYGDWDPRTRPWYPLARDANFRVVRRDGYFWEPTQSVYVSVLKAFKKLDGELGGVVAIDVSLKALTGMVQDIKLGETGFIMLVQGDGMVLVDGHSPDNNFKSISELKDAHFVDIANKESGVFETSIKGVEYMANVYASDKLGWKFIGFQQKAEILSSAQTLIYKTIAISTVLVLLFLLLGMWIAQAVVKPINQVKDSLREFAEGEGDLTARINVASRDETGELARWFNQFVASTQAMIDTIKQNSHAIHEVSSQTNQGSGNIADSAQQQHSSVDQVATAVTQMSSAANEVAKNCANTATVSEEGLSATREGKDIIEQSQAGVESLGTSIRESRRVISELEHETENINSILVAIQSIAEQTNLLALNAAIEAARAGAHGRGFAVVADEVRNLANRTQESTSEINTILTSLNKRTEQVSSNMSLSLEQAEAVIDTTTRVNEAFQQIESNVETIRDMTLQNASAAEEQHLVTEDINANVVAINEMASQVMMLAKELQNNASDQDRLSTELSELVSRFRT